MKERGDEMRTPVCKAMMEGRARKGRDVWIFVRCGSECALTYMPIRN